MNNKPVVKQGDKVRYYSPDGVHTGTVEKAEIRYGGTYASIKPDNTDGLVYLFHEAVEGFELMSENIHPWSPLAMARMRMMKQISFTEVKDELPNGTAVL